ncbi:MAG: hypothetical protein PHS38_00075 [Bacteroidales bacterium]|jgi:hypothetical protein|nr:hypothetical protein [Bacteroidales bacterium]
MILDTDIWGTIVAWFTSTFPTLTDFFAAVMQAIRDMFYGLGDIINLF